MLLTAAAACLALAALAMRAALRHVLQDDPDLRRRRQAGPVPSAVAVLVPGLVVVATGLLVQALS